jgi:hypothetical protein
MSAPPRPALKSPSRPAARPSAARETAAPTAVGAPKGVARQGVLSVLRSDPQEGRTAA